MTEESPEQQAVMRDYHNMLERKRRDHIKDSFNSLKDALPPHFFKGDKASRANILKKAADYIQNSRRRNLSHLADIDDLKRQNKSLEEEIRNLQGATSENTEDDPPVSSHFSTSLIASKYDSDSDTGSAVSSSDDEFSSQRKRQKTSSQEDF